MKKCKLLIWLKKLKQIKFNNKDEHYLGQVIQSKLNEINR